MTPEQTPDVRMLTQVINEGPWSTLLALADAYEELGVYEHRAIGLRWLAKWKKWPVKFYDGWHWWFTDRYTFNNHEGTNSHAQAYLPHESSDNHTVPTFEICSIAIFWAADRIGKYLAKSSPAPKPRTRSSS